MATIRKPYGPRFPVRISFPLPSLAQQQFKAETDINTIMHRFEKTGIIEHFNEHNGRYGDFSNVQSYQASLNQVMAAQDAFMSLPAGIRKRFDNDPEEFLAFATDPVNDEEMFDLGLKKRPPEAVAAPPEAEPPPEAPE